ncbi:MAG TPA: hypothetical protein VLK34_00345 [Nocardioidaceae bacterium]|nr:hypothetical protein [Nocardioidaceae bacterium]
MLKGHPAMVHDAEEVELHAEALGVLHSLRESAVGDHCRESLTKAWDVLITVRPYEQGSIAPAAVGTHRRASDFKKLQKLLLDLSMCPGVVRKDVILTMMFVTKAESEWVSGAPKGRSALARLRRRRTDTEAPATGVSKPA